MWAPGFLIAASAKADTGKTVVMNKALRLLSMEFLAAVNDISKEEELVANQLMEARASACARVCLFPQ